MKEWLKQNAAVLILTVFVGTLTFIVWKNDISFVRGGGVNTPIVNPKPTPPGPTMNEADWRRAFEQLRGQ